jgi:hypothetical protein
VNQKGQYKGRLSVDKYRLSILTGYHPAEQGQGKEECNEGGDVIFHDLADSR